MVDVEALEALNDVLSSEWTNNWDGEPPPYLIGQSNELYFAMLSVPTTKHGVVRAVGGDGQIYMDALVNCDRNSESLVLRIADLQRISCPKPTGYLLDAFGVAYLAPHLSAVNSGL